MSWTNCIAAQLENTILQATALSSAKDSLLGKICGRKDHNSCALPFGSFVLKMEITDCSGGASVLVKCESNGVFPSCSGAKKKKRKDFCSYQCTFCKGKIHGELCNLVKLARLLFLNRVAVSARGHEDNEAPLSDISDTNLIADLYSRY